MIKTTLHEPLSEEQEKRDTIHSIAWASVVVFGMLALLLHGLALMSWTEVTNEDIYARRRMENRVQRLEERYVGYENHTHRYFDGKIKQEKAK